MNIRAILCAASVAVLLTTPQTAVAHQGVKVGASSCEVAAGLGLIITSSKEMNCLFTSASGQSEPYSGTIRKFGLDIGATDQGVLAWDVFAPSEGPERGALAALADRAGQARGQPSEARVGGGRRGAEPVSGPDRRCRRQPYDVDPSHKESQEIPLLRLCVASRWGSLASPERDARSGGRCRGVGARPAESVFLLQDRRQ
jgi:hypothetical protein